MKSILCLIALLLPFSLFSETLVFTDFADPEAYEEIPEDYSEFIKGSLPAGVIEDSSWTTIQTGYSHQKNPLGGDRGWLEVQLGGGKKGQAQMKWTLPDLDSQAQYRFSVTMASLQNAPITFAIRDGGPPWAAHWQKTFSPSPYLNQNVVDFSLPPLGQGKVLIAHMGTRGTFHFQDIKLVRRDQAELERERKEKLANAPSNLLSVTHFPLGLPPLWSTGNRNSWERDIRVEPATGLSSRGTIPLHIATRTDAATLDLYSAPFEPLVRSEPHTLSFYIKGTVNDGSVAVTVNKKDIAQAILPSSPDGWTRVSLTFTPDALALFHVMHLSLKGDVLIDSLMLNIGTEPNPFQLKETAEVSLSAQRRKNHVIVDSVDAESVSMAVTAAPKGAQVRLAAVSFWGEKQVLAPLTMNGEAVEQTDIPLTGVFPGTPFGPFRIEAQVFIGDQPISPKTDLVIYRLRKPRHWGEVSTTSQFGGHFHDHEPHLYSSKAIGQNWNRLHGDNGKWTYWSGVEPEKGKWTFHHERLQAMQDAGFHIIGVWVHCPGWARIERQDKNGWLDNWWQPRDYQEFATYVEKVTKEYAPYIQHWQIWNEPWGEFWLKEWRPELGSRHQWHAGPSPDEDYVELSEIAYAAGKKAMEDVTVLGMSATIGDRGKNWMEKMLQLDAQKTVDDFSFHAYSGGGFPQQLSKNPNHLHGRINEYILDPIRKDPDITTTPPLWLTEGNVLGSRSHSGGGLYDASFVLEPDSFPLLQAESQLLSLYHLVCFSLGVDKVITYAINAVESHFHEKTGLYWGALGLNGGELNPSAAVYAATAWHTDSARFHKRLALEDVHAFVFQRGETAVAALIATSPRSQAWTPPADETLQWRDCLGNDSSGPFNFGTIVWVEREGSADKLAEQLGTLLR